MSLLHNFCRFCPEIGGWWSVPPSPLQIDWHGSEYFVALIEFIIFHNVDVFSLEANVLTLNRWSVVHFSWKDALIFPCTNVNINAFNDFFRSSTGKSSIFVYILLLVKKSRKHFTATFIYIFVFTASFSFKNAEKNPHCLACVTSPSLPTLYCYRLRLWELPNLFL